MQAISMLTVEFQNLYRKDALLSKGYWNMWEKIRLVFTSNMKIYSR